MMSNSASPKSSPCRTIVIALLVTTLGLASCGAGSSSSPASTPTTPVVPPPPAVVLHPITRFADATGGNVVVTSANSLTAGSIIVISGTTNYNGTFTVITATSDTFTITAPFVGDDATGAWISGGGVTAGCSSAGATAAITLPDMATVPSRFTGVAPLAVFFDAKATTATSTTQPFHELAYAWNFGDSAGGATWANGTGFNDSKNIAHGPIAAHVFETPGTYTIALAVTDGTNTVSNSCIQIAVQEPDVVFGSTATRCYSKTGNFSDCPAGATHVTDSSGDFDAVIAADLAQGRRLLFNRGESWQTSEPAVLNVNGPWTIGAYGDGAKPIIRRASGNTLMIFGWNGSNSFKDARVMDVSLDGNFTVPNPTLLSDTINGVDFNGTFNQITFLRVDIERVNNGMTQSATKANLAAQWDQFTVADSRILPSQGGAGGNGMYLFSSRAAILGNLFDNSSTGEHNFRSMFMDGLVVSNNTFRNPKSTKANLTLRGPTWYAQYGPTPAGTYAQYGVVSDNKFTGAAGVTQPVNTSVDASQEARTRHIIFERNWWTNQVATTTALNLDSSFSVIRNNLFDMSAVSGGQAIGVTNNNDTQSATGNFVYNNTIYANQPTSTSVIGVRMFNGALNTTIKNNLMYAPSASSTTVVNADLGSGTVGASGTFGNSSDAQAKSTSPSFANASGTFSTPSDFRITTGSYAIGNGVPVPVWADFFTVANSGSWDSGAVRH